MTTANHTQQEGQRMKTATHINSFQSTAMKRKGEAPTYSLWEKVVSVPAGPQKTIFGTVAIMPFATAMWSHVKGAPSFKTLAEAQAAFPGQSVSPYVTEKAGQ